MFAPPSRTVAPSAVLNTTTLQKIASWPGTLTLGDGNSSAVLDFGLEVGGIITIKYSVPQSIGAGAVGLAFTEAADWIGPSSDDSNPTIGRADGALYSNFTGPGDYTWVMPDVYLRGGFRYMTVFVAVDGTSFTISDASLEISYQPTWSNLRAYQGYFQSNDDQLNKLWYSGAYTVQTDALAPNTGRWYPAVPTLWANNATIGSGYSVLTDGAKRDRTVWPGDMGVAIPTAFYSTGDMESGKNSLQVLYDNQNSETGQLLYAGPPLSITNSDTYHMWTMIGTYNYVLYTDDQTFLQQNWAKYLKAMEWLDGRWSESMNLHNFTGATDDWGRDYGAPFMSQGQMIYYRTLLTGATLADWAGDTSGSNATWLQRAATLRSSINATLWDASAGAFINDPTNPTVYPQDANSLAILVGVVDPDSAQAQTISTTLTKNWTPIGAETPELPDTISPFVSSFEIQAHYLVGQPQRALDLIRTSWGWYFTNPNGTQSTMVEGYLTDGTWGYRMNSGYNSDYSYTSHSHGWSTGPVSTLTNHALGLAVTGRAGGTWSLTPQFGDLTSCEGGFATSLGQFTASWAVNSDGTYTLNYTAPAGTVGQITWPASGGSGGNTTTVTIDGRVAEARHIARDGSFRRLLTIEGRGDGKKHTIEFE